MIKLTERLEWAIRTSALAHREHKRKGSNLPYIIHPYSVMLIASEATEDEDILIACLFHDIIEDVPEYYPEDKMRQEFGDRVVDIVRGVTKDDGIADWNERSLAYLSHLEHESLPESVIVSAADKIHNLMSMISDYQEIGEKLWDKFHSSKEEQLWWYKSVEELVSRLLPESPLSDRLKECNDTLEKMVKNSPVVVR